MPVPGSVRRPKRPTAPKDKPPQAAGEDVDRWFERRGWQVFPFQRAVWQAAGEGRSGLLHATTGSGKTYAVWFAAVLRALRQPPSKTGLRVLWITPMRALAADTARALQAPLEELLPAWRVGLRTGDTSSSERSRQAKALPQTLITTPESLSLMLSRADGEAQMGMLDMVIVDEWHELMGSKRGAQTQLALARLRLWRPELVVWGLSATLGNLRIAQDALLGEGADNGELVEGRLDKEIAVDTLIPPDPAIFPWAGHLGMRMLQPVIEEIDAHAATLVFTNTRAQAELWYQQLIEARPDWAGLIALHHGSLDKAVRDWVEQAVKQGELKAVVCTSSLDLGVDFLPVERVLQIGSPKGVARLIQRAGRSGHAPGRVSRVTLVPTHSLELLEAAAARRAVARRRIESRPVPEKPLDVLVQHMVTIALGGGFTSDALFEEVKTAYAYRKLSKEEWQWALEFVASGGQSLAVYPEYRRVLPDEQGVYRVPDAALARRHRMSIGTIVSDAAMQVKFLSGTKLGTVEESFISRLRKGDHFLFGGRVLEFVRVHEMTAYVRRGGGGKAAVPRWQGGKMPLSSELAQAALDCLQEAAQHRYDGPEMQAIRPLLEVQQRWSGLPTAQVLLAEQTESREGHHLFLYPFAGRSVHIGLASLLAWRVAKTMPATFSMAVNDYGFELLSLQPVEWRSLLGEELLSPEHLLEDVLASLNATELAQRRFREIARIAGLIFQGMPGQKKSARQLQASSSLFFEVFRKHDAGNLLLTQAQREVLEQELELSRLREALVTMRQRRLDFHVTRKPTPFAFPLMVERLREKLSNEKLSDRVARMLRELQKAAEK
ncbi:ligase-associated DNA damage response DEXH box helicase [Noviherbaspirillum aerium]|uniref:ligase-associated DNA damage response DEXH box helicase n=1 Tax=Noviherbaspirillum aerium TaxID=2588497 RepID=UPI00384E5012